MYDRTHLERLKTQREAFDRKVEASGAEREAAFVTSSGRPIRRLYGPTDVPDLDYERDLGLPGDYPYTRGIHPTG